MDVRKDSALFTSNAREVLLKVRQELEERAYKDILLREAFVYAPGDLPVLVVAHADTVHDTPPREDAIFYDREKAVLWSPQGLGADDRAGVLGILEILRRGLRPYVLITDGEEFGCLGARAAVREIEPPPGVRFVVQLDRRGETGAVFYDCTNEKFKAFVLEHGFAEAQGSFSDISVLCPGWNIAGVNLSCGFYDEHSTREYLNLNHLARTVDAVERILRHIPNEPFSYKGKGEKKKLPARADDLGRYYSCMQVFPYGVCRVEDDFGELPSLEVTVPVDVVDIVEQLGIFLHEAEAWFVEHYDELCWAAEEGIWHYLNKRNLVRPF